MEFDNRCSREGAAAGETGEMVESKSKKTKEGGHSFGGDGLAFFPGNLLSSLTCIVSLFARRHRFWRSLCFWFFVRTGTRGSCGSRCCSPPRERKVDDDGLMPASADEGDDAAPPRLASVAPAAAAAPAISRRRPIATTSGPSLSSSISKRRDGESGERLGHGTRVTKSNRERRKMKEKKNLDSRPKVFSTPPRLPPLTYSSSSNSPCTKTRRSTCPDLLFLLSTVAQRHSTALRPASLAASARSPGEKK